MKHWTDRELLFKSYVEEKFSDEDAPMILHAILSGTCFRHKIVRGIPRFSAEDFDATMARIGGRAFYDNGGSYRGFSFRSGVVTRLVGSNGAVILDVRSADDTLTNTIAEFANEWLAPIPPAATPLPSVYSFAREHGSLSVKEIGPVEGVLRRSNYANNIVLAFDYVVAQLKHPSPSGRLVLLEGEPGTGKTHLVRAVICTLASACKCILIPPNVIADLSGPEFLQALMNHRRSDKAPMVLILEDADDALIAREQNATAKSSLSGLLNLSDGILGAALDVRVIATTNQKFDNLDRAVLRPGRLLKRMSVGALSADEAAACFHGLTGRTRIYHAPATLAEVYEHTTEGTAA